MANARKVRLSSTPEQAQNGRNRRLKNLARRGPLDPKLLYPLKHRGEEGQAHIYGHNPLPAGASEVRVRHCELGPPSRRRDR